MKTRITFIREHVTTDGKVRHLRLFCGSESAARIYLASGGDPGTLTLTAQARGYQPPQPRMAEYSGLDRPTRPVPAYVTIAGKTGKVHRCQRHGVNPVTGLCRLHSPDVNLRPGIQLPERPAQCDALTALGERIGRLSTGVVT